MDAMIVNGGRVHKHAPIRASHAARPWPPGLPGADVLHVWDVDLADPRWDAHGDVLAPAEAERFARVLMKPARDDWRRSRVALRLLVARYLADDARAFRFGQGSHGKPRLDRADFAASFNVSHSAGRALIALAAGEVGVDIERVADRVGDEAALAARILAASEAAPGLNDAGGVATSFYRLWTRKEAYCKATGLGLYKAMASFRIETTGEATVSRVHDADAADGTRWFIHDLACDPGWMAAVCTPLAAPVIHRRLLEPIAGLRETLSR